jgi:tetratricopeptide (TPR) repeat protein
LQQESVRPAAAFAATLVAPSGEARQHYLQGRNCKAAGDLHAAEHCYRQALALAPDYIDAWISLGILYRLGGRPAEAADCQQRALLLDPLNTAALLNLGNALHDQGAFAEAATHFHRVLELDSTSAEAHNNLASILWRNQDLRAIHYYQQALQQRPDYFEAAEGLGICLFFAARYQEAADAFELACRLRPAHMNCQLALANSLLGARQFEAARAQYERLLKSHPGMPKARAGLAATLAGLGQYSRPLALFREAIAHEPDDSWIHAHYTQFLLRSGDFAQAWHYYEYRWRFGETRNALERGYAKPRWQGEPLQGRRLLIISEQGLGDEIMFASTFAEAIAATNHCIIECDARLLGLFRRSFPAATFFGVGKTGDRAWHGKLGEALHDLPPFDLWTAAGTFVGSRRRSRADFPRHEGYLLADAGRIEHWRQQLAQLPAGRRIGISWRGGTAVTNQQGRSLSLAQLAPLLREPGTQFISLQYGDCATEIAAFESTHGVRVHHWPEAIADYDETAALVCALDRVVSVCTAVVHLAGALGRPAWVMAPQVAEWRYGHEGTDMVWYPAVTICRQPRAGDWGAVIAQLRRALRKGL